MFYRQRRPCPWIVTALGLPPGRALSSATTCRVYQRLTGNDKGYPGGLGWKTSKGLWKPRHFRGRWFNARTWACSCLSVTFARSLPLGGYCRKSPLVFSLVPRSQANTRDSHLFLCLTR